MESQDKPHMRSLGINFQEIIARIIKYIVEGTAVAIAAYVIPRRKLDVYEVVMVALTAAAVFAILDLYAPAVSAGARQGAGFGIGFGMLNAPGIALPGGAVVPGIPPPVA